MVNGVIFNVAGNTANVYTYPPNRDNHITYTASPKAWEHRGSPDRNCPTLQLCSILRLVFHLPPI